MKGKAGSVIATTKQNPGVIDLLEVLVKRLDSPAATTSKIAVTLLEIQRRFENQIE
jgi:hypothetical protein